MSIYVNSDLTIKLSNGTVPAHCFVLSARGDSWLSNNKRLDDTKELGMFLSSSIHVQSHSILIVIRLDRAEPRHW